MAQRWYQSRQVQAAMIGGVFVVIAAAITILPGIIRNSEPAKRTGDAQIADSIFPADESSADSGLEQPKTAEILRQSQSDLATVSFDLSEDQVDSSIQNVLRQFRARKLKPLENELAVSRIPAITNFYIGCHEIAYYGATSDLNNVSLIDYVRTRGAMRRGNYGSSLRFVKVSDNDIRMFGFITTEAGTRLTTATDSVTVEFILSTILWDDFDCLVMLPIHRVSSIYSRSADSDTHGSVRIFEIAYGPVDTIFQVE